MPEIIANLLGRASGRKFIDFNPVKKFWSDDKINALGTQIYYDLHGKTTHI